MPGKAFDEFPTHPVSVDTLDGIEAVVLAIQQLREAMSSVPQTHRWLASSMMSDRLGDVYRMIQDDQRQFEAHRLKDIDTDQWQVREATPEEIDQHKAGRQR